MNKKANEEKNYLNKLHSVILETAKSDTEYIPTDEDEYIADFMDSRGTRKLLDENITNLLNIGDEKLKILAVKTLTCEITSSLKKRIEKIEKAKIGNNLIYLYKRTIKNIEEMEKFPNGENNEEADKIFKYLYKISNLKEYKTKN